MTLDLMYSKIQRRQVVMNVHNSSSAQPPWQVKVEVYAEVVNYSVAVFNGQVDVQQLFALLLIIIICLCICLL